MKQAVMRIPLLLGLLWVLPVVALAGDRDCARVDVDGHRLYFCTRGSGGPVVVMDAGLKDFSRSWSTVLPKLARHGQVLVYDRAGLGKSDNASGPRTSEQIAQDLYSLLKRAGIPGPYVLVGHEFGGWNMRVFAARYPAETAALILIDSPHEDFDAVRKRMLSRSERVANENSLRANRSVSIPRGIRLEYSSQDASREQVRRAGSLGNTPLVVVAATRHKFSPRDKADRLEKIWQDQQKDLARLSKNSKLLIAAKSGSYVQFDQPEVVVDAVRMALEAVRTGKPLASISYRGE